MPDRPEPSRARRRNRRRTSGPPRFDTSVPSPCVEICQIDQASGLCIGCRRTLREIGEWPTLSAEDKRALLAELERREPPDGR